ncbi:hypothetical protein SDC9_105202 [bioreactor metagenome]|uniref:Uncharacterized protein n=1 Tax=bioreactor metagenome TaxID=1076179 RepID=A0A645B1C7_9ZZZZ
MQLPVLTAQRQLSQFLNFQESLALHIDKFHGEVLKGLKYFESLQICQNGLRNLETTGVAVHQLD